MVFTGNGGSALPITEETLHFWSGSYFRSLSMRRWYPDVVVTACHPSRRLATSISPPRKTAKNPSHRLAKWQKHPSHRLVKSDFKRAIEKFSIWPFFRLRVESPEPPENSAVTGFFCTPPLSSMLRTQCEQFLGINLYSSYPDMESLLTTSWREFS